MDPNNVVGTPNIQAQPVAPVAPVASAEPVASQPEINPMTMGPKKSSKGGIIAAILFAILAVGGIGFGVYTMMDGNTQKEKLNDRIAALEKTNSELMEQIGEGEGGEDFKNPLIKVDAPQSYSLIYSRAVDTDGTVGNDTYLTIAVNNGQIESCSYNNVSKCGISGLTGNIYKVVDIYEGNGGYDNDIVGFLMEDGSLWYARIYDGLSVNTNLVAKEANMSGLVKDVVRINYCPGENMGCYGSTIFVLSDDSYIKYDESMFE